MKFGITLTTMLLCTTLFSQTGVSGQTKKQLEELLDMASAYLEEKEQAGFSVIKQDDSRKLVEYFNSNGEWWKKKEKFLGTEYNKPIVFKKLPGESSRINWLKGIPVPLMPEAALRADPRENEKYAERIKTAYEQMRAEANQLANSTDMAKLNAQGNDAVKKMYEQQVNQQALIAQMGGLEKLSQMTDAEREQAARAAVAKQTGGYTPEQLKKMTPEQQKAVAMQMQQHNKTQQNTGTNNSAEANEIMMLEKHAMELSAQIAAALQPVATRIKQNEQLFEQRKMALQDWVAAAESKLPMVEDSEYGGRRDGIERVLFARDVMIYFITKNKIQNDRELWESYVNALVPVLQKLDDFTAAYEKRNNLSDRMKIAIANCKMAGYESIIEANRVAGYLSNLAASVQRQYNCAVVKECE